MSNIREEGNWVSMSLKNHPHVPYVADLAGSCLFTHIASSGCEPSVRETQCTPQGQPCRAHCLSLTLCTVGICWMTAASFPCGMLIPILYASTVCEMVSAVLIVVPLPSP